MDQRTPLDHSLPYTQQQAGRIFVNFLTNQPTPLVRNILNQIGVEIPQQPRQPQGPQQPQIYKQHPLQQLQIVQPPQQPQRAQILQQPTNILRPDTPTVVPSE